MMRLTQTGRLLRAALVLAAVASTLVIADRVAARRDERVRPLTAILKELVSTPVVASEIVELHLLDSTGRSIEYRRTVDDDLWRCMTGHGALADATRLNRLLSRTLGGGGLLRTDDPRHAARYGLDGPATVRMRLYKRAPNAADTEADEPTAEITAEPELVLDLDIGLALRNVDQCFVRLHGSHEIIAMEADIRDELRPDGPGGLPLIEPYLVPTSWPGLQFTPRQLIILRRGALPVELRREDILDESGEPTGWRWLIRTGDGEFERAHDALPLMFMAFLSRIRLIGILGPDAALESGLETPIGRVLIGTDFTPPMELRLAASHSFATPVYVGFARTVSMVTNEIAALMLPGPELFHPDAPENPWAAYTDPSAAPPQPFQQPDGLPGAQPGAEPGAQPGAQPELPSDAAIAE